MPKVSVIIPVYNTEKYLRKCLDSVCNQTLYDIEIICINDCSLDSSFELLKEFAQQDDRIKLIDFNENKGAAAARNAGLDAAQGEFVGFVDSDDFVDADFYEKLYTKAKETDADAVKSLLKIDNPLTGGSYIPEDMNLNKKIKNNPAYFYFTFTTAIYRRTFLKDNEIRFPEGLINLEDPYFLIKAALKYNKLVLIGDTYYHYCDNANSMTKSKSYEYLCSTVDGVIKIVDLLNDECSDKEHYLVVYNTFVSELINRANNIYYSDKFTDYILNGLYEVLQKCKYKEEALHYYFLEKKKNAKQIILKNIRNKFNKERKGNINV